MRSFVNRFNWQGRLAILAVLAICALPLAAGGRQTSRGAQQQPSTPSYGNGSRTPTSNFPDLSAGPSPMNPARLEKMREEERRKRLQSDTAKLLQLSTELKDEVDKTSKDELSLDVVRKATEIEKLAHDVKERMRS